MLIRSLIVALALIWTTPAWAQFTFGAQFTGNVAGGANNFTVNMTSVSAGDLLVCTTRERDGAASPSVSDSVNGAWTEGASVVGAGEMRSTIHYYINSGSGSPTVTVTYSGNVTAFGNCQRYTPTGTVTFDQTATRGQATGTSHSSGSITTSSGNVLLVSNITTNADPTSMTYDSDYTSLTELGSRLYSAYRIGTGSITDTATHTSGGSVASVGAHVSFVDGAGGGGATCTGGLMLLGAGKC